MEKKMTIGIIFEFAYLPELPVDPWDQPLSLVCTELGIRNCR
jgi:5-formyltetrahydrofolate cyclo-ligase